MTLFIGADTGPWRVVRMETVKGLGLEPVKRLVIVEQDSRPLPRGRWVLRGVTSYERYVTRAEHDELAARQPALGRLEATCAALIPVRKSQAWWDLAQDERREIFETHSGHIKTGLKYLPAIARRLYHSRDLGEPFDFLTWFEYAPKDADAFEELVNQLRQSEEWTYVEQEVDIRLVKVDR